MPALVGETGQVGSASRSGERSSPSTTTPVSPDGSVTSTTAVGPSPAELARIELKQKLRAERERRQDAKKNVGRFDPVRSAVRYADTLGRVSN